NRYIGRDWMPQDDQNELGVYLELPEGSSLEATEQVTKEIADKMAAIPGVTAVVPASMNMMINRVTMSGITILLRDQTERGDINEMAGKVRAVMRDYPYTRPRINFPNALGGRDSFAPIRGMLLGPDLRKLSEIGKDVSRDLAKTNSVVDVKV